MSERIDWTQPQYCGGCERPLRPANKKLSEWPGTILHAARGVCATCYKSPNGSYPPPPVDGPREDAQANAFRNFANLVADRRRRGIPPGGLRPNWRTA